jgi:hypothetical protein
MLGLKRTKATLTPPDKNTHLYVRSRGANGVFEIRREIPEEGKSVAVASGDQGIYVSLARWPLELQFPAILRDDDGHAWDLHLHGSWAVDESRRFVCSTVMNAASSSVDVSNDLVQSWIVRATNARVLDAVRDQNIEDLRSKDALPARWWEKNLCEWLTEQAISVQVAKVEFVSAEAEAAEAEATRQRDLERLSQARERERDAEIREAAGKAEYEKEKKRIEADMAISEQERAHQLQILERRHRKELIEADAEIANARREAEKAALEHEATMARLRRDTEAVAQAEVRGKEAEDRHQAVLKEIDGLKSTLARIADLPDNLLAQLADRDARRSNAAAERLVSPEFGVSASALAALGFRVERQNLVEALRQKSARDDEKVTIRKTELVTRDIGTAKVKGLPINTSLQFEFTTLRSGHVTLINIGTSGSVYVHVPNAYVTLDHAKVDRARSYAIPGPELLPWDRLRQLGLDYVEVGPPGWEHIAVLISDRPLVNSRVLASASSDAPFVKLAAKDVAELCETLTDEPAEQWSAGVLSFLVG